MEWIVRPKGPFRVVSLRPMLSVLEQTLDLSGLPARGADEADLHYV